MTKEPARLWAYAQIADHTGVNVGTLRVWRSRSKLPVADFTVGDEEWPAWWPATIQDWWAARQRVDSAPIADPE